MDGSEIYIDGTYLKNNPQWGLKDSTWKADVILQLLKRNKITPDKVIEVGCGAGGVLDSLSNKLGNQISFSGYDISPQAIEMAKEKESDHLKFYNKDFLAENGSDADLVLVIDVLEHVPDYYGFLEKLKMKSNYFVFHIPLDISSRSMMKPHILLQQRSSVGHIHYFTKEMVLWILKDKGFEIIEWIYTKPAIDREAPATFKNSIKKSLRNLSFYISKDISAKLWGNYSMMILAK